MLLGFVFVLLGGGADTVTSVSLDCAWSWTVSGLMAVSQSEQSTGRLGLSFLNGFPFCCTTTLPCYISVTLFSSGGWEAGGTVSATEDKPLPCVLFSFLFPMCGCYWCFKSAMNEWMDSLRVNNIDNSNGNNPHRLNEVFSSSLVSCHWTTQKECFKDKKHYICIFLYPDAI